MPLPAGTRFGPYEILSALGAGGMGEVYRARDTRLERDVAVKVLPAAFASDRERVARFEREAKAVAAISHPNILAIHDTGTESGQLFVVTELLEGETLRERLTGALPVRKAIDVAIQIARGLAAAHDKGIVHRDLKPENVFLTSDGQVKILDFGLARHLSTNTGDSGTVSAMTDPGTVMGTVGYMAPEQVRAQPVDARTDLFALGAVLYEMLSGRRAFQRDTSADTMFAIVREDPPELTATRADLPPALDRIVRHCLEKNPSERFQTARDVAFALEALSGSGAPATSTVSASSSVPSEGRRLPVMSLVVLVVVAALAAGGAFIGGVMWNRPETHSYRGALLGGSVAAFDPRIAPNDGQSLAFEAMDNGLTQIAVMTPDSGVTRILTKARDRGPISGLCWSAGGTEIFFGRVVDRPGGIFRVPLNGGEERLLVPDAVGPEALPDGKSLLAVQLKPDGTRQLVRYWLSDGKSVPLNAQPLAGGVRVFPDGHEAVFYGRPADLPKEEPHLFAIDLDSNTTRRLAPTSEIPRISWLLPFAVTQASVLFGLPAGDAYQIVSVPRDGSSSVTRLLTLTEWPLRLDVDAHGTIFVDQATQPLELQWHAPDGRILERMGLAENYEKTVLALPDGRVLVPMQSAGKHRVMAVSPGHDAEPFFLTPDETAWPMTMLADNRVAVMLGTAPRQRVAIFSARDGRFIRPLTRPPGTTIALAGTASGKLFYVTDHTVWATSDDDVEPQRVAAGEAVAVEPDGQHFIVQVIEQHTVRLMRYPIAGGNSPEILAMTGDVQFTADESFGPQAVSADGRIAMRVGFKDSWFFGAAVRDRSGRLQPVPAGFPADVLRPALNAKGQLVMVATGFHSRLWRFEPESRAPVK